MSAWFRSVTGRAYHFYFKLLARGQQFAKPGRRLLPVEAAGGYRQNELLPFWSVGRRLNPVQAKKNNTTTERRPLVAINEGVIPTEVIQIRSRDFGQIPIR